MSENINSNTVSPDNYILIGYTGDQINSILGYIQENLHMFEVTTNRQGSISPNNPNNNIYYPTVKAVVDYVDSQQSPLLANSKFIVKEYPSFNDFPAIKVTYRYSTSFNYTWGPPEDYYRYQDGKWITDVDGVNLEIHNPPFIYTHEDLKNVTCKITSQLPKDIYPDITVNSFELSYAYGNVTPNYIEVGYYPILNTSYGDSQHNPYTNNISFSFDIIFPEKINPEISLNVLYKAADTGKLYIPNITTLEWEEYTGSYLDGTPLVNMIDQQKQDKLKSGENIKTINGGSLLGSGNFSLATTSSLSSLLPKSYVRNSRSTSTAGYTYDVRYINNMIQTSKTTSNYNVYDCNYINSLIKTSKTTSANATYSCNYMNSNFLTLATLPRWDGGNQ